MKPAPDLSMVFPVVERHGDLDRIFNEYATQVESLGLSAEYIFVVDYREREVIPMLRELQAATDREVVLVLLGGTFGESSALTVALDRARGRTIATVASYFQVEPEGFRDAYATLEAGADLVIGRRHPRVDSFFNRLQTGLFHRIVNWMTSSNFKDISSGFRLMKRRVADELNVYGGLHRFIPILAANQGFKVVELPIPQRAEDTPTRYYGVAVYFKRILDVLTIFFLMKFTRRPLRFFGLIGLGVSSVGGAITLYLGIYRLLDMGAIAGRPLLLLGVLLMVLGVQTLSLGLIGEIIIFTHARSMRDYQVAEIIEKDAGKKAQEIAAPVELAG